MNPLLRPRSPNRLVVIEIGATHVTGVVGRLTSSPHPRDLYIEQWTEHAVPPGPIGNGNEAETEVVTALRAVLIALRVADPVTLVLPGHFTWTKLVELPPMGAAQREGAIELELRQHLPFPLAEVAWGSRCLAAPGAAGALIVQLAAVKRDLLNPLLDTLVAMEVELAAVRAAALVMAGAAPSEAAEATLRLDVGARSTHLQLVCGPTLALRTLSLAGGTITRTIADALGQTWVEAEHLKLQVLRDAVALPPGSPAGRAVAEAVDQFVQRLTAETGRTLALHQQANASIQVRRMVLAGGGASVPGLAEALANRLQLSVSTADALAGVTFAAGATRGRSFGYRAAAWVGAMRTPADETVNLLPGPGRWRPGGRARRRRWLVAVAMMFAAVALPGWHHHRLAAARIQNSDALARELVGLREVAAANRARMDRLDTLQREAEVWREVVSARGAWMEWLAELQARVGAVPDAWIERLLVVNEGESTPPTALRLRVSARLLDRQVPLGRVGGGAYERASELLRTLVESGFVQAVEGERFDAGVPGILRVDFTLRLNPSRFP